MFQNQKPLPNTTYACTTQRGSLARLTPSTGPATTLCLEARTHSRLLSFLLSREIGADFNCISPTGSTYLFGCSDFDGKADGDKEGAREDQRNPGNVVSVAGIKRDLLVASCQLCTRILRCWAMALLDCTYFITTSLHISMLTDRTR